MIFLMDWIVDWTTLVATKAKRSSPRCPAASIDKRKYRTQNLPANDSAPFTPI